MKENFFIKYKGLDHKDDGEISIASLGESLIGFDLVLKEVFKVSKLKGEISLGATKTRKGSLIIDIVIYIANNPDCIPFERVDDFLNFLKVVNSQLFASASAFFNEIGEGHRTINDYFLKNPFDLNAYTTLFSLYAGFMIGKAKENKIVPKVDETPKNYSESLHRLIKRGVFKKAMVPFIEGEISEIEISSDNSFSHKEIINVRNFEDYLNEKNIILPEYIDGGEYVFTASLVSLQSTHGDSMKLRIHGFDKRYRDLVTFPESGRSTKDYTKFYDENVLVRVRIQRESMYQKPKLQLLSMVLQQTQLGL